MTFPLRASSEITPIQNGWFYPERMTAFTGSERSEWAGSCRSVPSAFLINGPLASAACVYGVV